MFKFYNFIIYIFLFISNASLAEDNLKVITTKLKNGDTFYKVFSDMKINKSDSKLFISSLQRKLDLKRMPTGQELKFYFINNPPSLMAVAVPLRKNITVLTWKKKDSITSVKISDKLLKHKLMNPTTGNLNQVNTLLGKKKSDRKAYDVAKNWLGDQGVSDDDIEKQSEEGDVGEVQVRQRTYARGSESRLPDRCAAVLFKKCLAIFSLSKLQTIWFIMYDRAILKG